jgi:hypothetical protein
MTDVDRRGLGLRTRRRHPVALDRRLHYWDDFPYSDVARLYDVILPMGYYTFHVHGGAATYAETVSNVRILRHSR